MLTQAHRGTTLRCRRNPAPFTAAVTGLPRSVLVRVETPFFRELPGDGRIDASGRFYAVDALSRTRRARAPSPMSAPTRLATAMSQQPAMIAEEKSSP
jgi:hypothetical protein